MRIRTIKPEWIEDERLASASDSARLLSVGLILMADDHGNGRAHELFIASRVWPYGDPHETLMKVSSSLVELEECGFIARYRVNGQWYFTIRNWTKHQKVQHPSKPRVPLPGEADSGETHESLTKSSLLTPTTDLTNVVSESGDSGSGVLSNPEPDDVDLLWRHILTRRQQCRLAGKPPKLTDKRRRHIKARLKHFSLDEMKAAAEVIFTPNSWHIRECRTDPDLIYRSHEQAEKMIARSGFKPRDEPTPNDDGMPMHGIANIDEINSLFPHTS